MNKSEKLGILALEKIKAQEQLDWCRKELKKAYKESGLQEPVSVHLDEECLTISPPTYPGSLPIVKRFRRID